MRSLILCLQFLTRLYLPWMIEGGDDMFARSMKFFPVAGLIIGLVDAGVLWAGLRLFSPSAAAVLTVLMDTAITGGLHMDGLADTIDGLSSHRDRERMLEIMKDSHIGTFGVIAVVGTLMTKAVMYRELAAGMDGWRMLGVILAVPVVARTVMAVLIFISRYARKEGMGGLFFAYKKSMNLPVALILGIVFSFPALMMAPVLWIGGFGAGLLVRAVCYRKIGGMTGDTLGAALEIAETTMLLLTAALVKCIL